MARSPWMAVAWVLAAVSLLLSGAMAGFFYAYSVSVMRGLDAVAPADAIRAMQGINATIRNAAFAPAFFGTPVAEILAGLTFLLLKRRAAGLLLLLAAAVYIGGAFVPTVAVNVPMNEALAVVQVPEDPAAAASLWHDYAARWTRWNDLRTLFSLVGLLLVGGALAFGRQVRR